MISKTASGIHLVGQSPASCGTAAPGCENWQHTVQALQRSRPPEWCRKYIGKPFADHGRGPDSYDCWGLALAVLCEEFGITGLPDYGEAYSGSCDWPSVSKAVATGLEHGWKKLKLGLDFPAPGDLVIINLAGRPFHCGIFVAQPDWMLHALEGTDVVLEQLSRPMWSKGNRIEGIYRYGKMPSL